MASAEALPPAARDLQGHVGAGPVAVGHQNTTALPDPGGQPAGERRGDRPRDRHDHQVHAINEGGDHRRPFGSGVGHEREPVQCDPALRGGQSTQRGHADHSAPGAGTRSRREQRKQQRRAPTGTSRRSVDHPIRERAVSPCLPGKRPPSLRPSEPRLPGPQLLSPQLPRTGLSRPQLPGPQLFSPRLPGVGLPRAGLPSPQFPSPRLPGVGLPSPGLPRPRLAGPWLAWQWRARRDGYGASSAQSAARQEATQLGNHRQHPVTAELVGVAGRPHQLRQGGGPVDHPPRHGASLRFIARVPPGPGSRPFRPPPEPGQRLNNLVRASREHELRASRVAVHDRADERAGYCEPRPRH